MAKDPSLRKQNDLARDVDRLLRQLPFGDPMLRGDGVVTPRAARRPGAGASTGIGASAAAGTGTSLGIRAGNSAAASAPAFTRRAPTEPSALAQRISGWLRALLAVALAAAVTVWPYASDCGWMLYLALVVVLTVVVAGAWAGIWTWRLRLPAAHVLSIGVLVWGLVLAAELVLPRVGYAATTAAWTCPVR